MSPEILKLLQDLLALAGGLFGVAALVTVPINIGKANGIVPDGKAPDIQAGVALLVVVVGYGARLFGVELDWTKIDGIAATLAQLIGLLVVFGGQIGFGKLFHAAVKGVSVIGFSHSKADQTVKVVN